MPIMHCFRLALETASGKKGFVRFLIKAKFVPVLFQGLYYRLPVFLIQLVN